MCALRAELTRDLFPRSESLCAAHPRGKSPGHKHPILPSVRHSNDTRPKKVFGFMFGKRS
jgi:hypothetical protein